VTSIIFFLKTRRISSAVTTGAGGSRPFYLGAKVDLALPMRRHLHRLALHSFRRTDCACSFGTSLSFSSLVIALFEACFSWSEVRFHISSLVIGSRNNPELGSVSHQPGNTHTRAGTATLFLFPSSTVKPHRSFAESHPFGAAIHVFPHSGVPSISVCKIGRILFHSVR